tara:strand:+ start:165 stop:374 length:210 start_codon:yes stop_codon:yes gene_type:complete
MKKISLLILLSTFLISCGSDCDCKKHKMKAKYKISHSTGETMFDGVEIDSVKMKKIREWRKAKRDSLKK